MSDSNLTLIHIEDPEQWLWVDADDIRKSPVFGTESDARQWHEDGAYLESYTYENG